MQKEIFVRVGQKFNARYTALSATISPNTIFNSTIVEKVIRIPILGLFLGGGLSELFFHSANNFLNNNIWGFL
jgi:hypothetical protein